MIWGPFFDGFFPQMSSRTRLLSTTWRTCFEVEKARRKWDRAPTPTRLRPHARWTIYQTFTLIWRLVLFACKISWFWRHIPHPLFSYMEILFLIITSSFFFILLLYRDIMPHHHLFFLLHSSPIWRYYSSSSLSSPRWRYYSLLSPLFCCSFFS